MMSEHKIRELAEKLAAAAADQKGLIAIGFEGYRMAIMPKGAPDIQVRASIMQILDPGYEPTERDLERMSKIHDELQAFAKAVEDGKFN